MAGKIPPRDPNTPPRLVDLSDYYNFAFSAMPGEEPDNNLASLPTGIQRLAGVDFDVRGGIMLRGMEIHLDFPSSIDGIRVAQSCQRLHFLCATIAGSPRGARVGAFVMRNANGAESELPLIYHETIDSWWREDAKPEEGPRVAWTGQNPAARAGRNHLHLYRLTWENSEPGQSVASITFRSELATAAPFLIAITAE